MKENIVPCVSKRRESSRLRFWRVLVWTSVSSEVPGGTTGMDGEPGRTLFVVFDKAGWDDDGGRRP